MKFDGDVNVKNVKKFYESLKEEFTKSDEIVIDFSDVLRIDLSAAQVIIAAGRKAKEVNKIVRITGVSNDLKKLFKLSGLKV